MRFLLKYTRRNDIPLCAISVIRVLTSAAQVVVVIPAVIIPAAMEAVCGAAIDS